MRRAPLLLAGLLVAAASSVSISAAESERDGSVVHDIRFPVLGEVEYTDTFGHPRGSGRTHAGQDIFGDKMQELVATDSGVVAAMVWPESSYGFYLRLVADDGWTYSYAHINNDTPGTDDGKAERDDVYGPGIELGVHVERGQLLGYLGDSGNAEHTPPHLHFEMRDPDGKVINPMASLDAAERGDATEAAEASPIERLAGADRVATAVAASQRGWQDGARVAVLAAGDAYAEALPASVLAAAGDGPLLLVGDKGLTRALTDELDRLDVDTVITIGSVSVGVDEELEDDGHEVRRVGVIGDPAATAAAIADEVGGKAGVAVVVNGDRFADGVSAAALAAGRGWPILLTTVEVVPQASVDAWRALGVERLVLLGGTAVIGQNIEAFVAERGGCETGAAGSSCAVERVAGTDRYGTSVAAAEWAITDGDRSVETLLLGTGANYPDSLASGSLAARLGGVALLIDGTGRRNDAASRSFLAEHAGSVDAVAILGGLAAVTSAADRSIQEALGLR